MKGVEAVANILKQEGVEYLFAYPANPLIDAAAAVGIRPIIARTEKTLVNIADGYCRATNGRRPAVVVVQQGPGIENAFGGLAQAFADRIPLLVLPGGPDQHHAGGTAEFDPMPSYRNIMKWTGRVNFASRIPALMRRAFSLVRSSPLGPVMLELPGDVAAADVDQAAMRYQPPRAYRSAGDPADVAEAARMLLEARAPVILAGHGVLWAEATDELRELAELTGVPVTTTMPGKSAFPEDHPLSLGTGSRTMTRQAAQFLLKADLIFGVGTGFARSTFAAPIPTDKTIVQITDNPRDVDQDVAVAHAVVGDAQLVLHQLIEEVKRQGGGRAAARDGVAAAIAAAREAYLREWMPRLTSNESPISPYRVIWELHNAVDRANTIVTHDSGNPRDQILTFYGPQAPRGYLGWGKSTQLGTGYGIALGAKLAHPDKLCVNLMGDLAFGTAGTEVETAVRERIPIMTVLVNNSRLGGYGHHMPTASERYNSNKLTGDYTKLAEALGAYAERVERADDVAAALKRGIDATRQGRPVVLEMITKEDPHYPVAGPLMAELAKELSTAAR